MSPVLMTGILALTTVMMACNAQTETPTRNTEHAENAPTQQRTSSLPADYIAGGVYNMAPKICVSHGGSISVDGNGISFCSLGEAEAIYVCQNGTIASIITQKKNRLLHLSSGLYEEVEEKHSESTAKYLGEHYSIFIQGEKVQLISAAGKVDCTPAN